MRTLLRNSMPVPFDALDEEIQPVVTRSGKRSVEIRLSDAVDAPSVIGFFRPPWLCLARCGANWRQTT